MARSDLIDVFAVRWPVLKGVDAEGLLLQPAAGRKTLADVVAIPDAGQSPEEIAGLVPGVAHDQQFAKRLADLGCRVLVPLLVDRSDAYSVSVAGQATNQPHREFVYRPAFELGRHLIGYEVQKVLALVDWLRRRPADRQGRRSPSSATARAACSRLHAAAFDPRIDAAVVSGYFGPQQSLEQPIDRNVFGLLDEFGDAELAALCAAGLLVDRGGQGPER